MEINTTDKHLQADPLAFELITFLRDNEESFGLTDSLLYHDFPLYKDDEGNLVVSKILIVSFNVGLVVVGTSGVTNHEDVNSVLANVDAQIEQVFSSLYSRLLRNRNLRKTRTELRIATNSALFAPQLERAPRDLEIETAVLVNMKQVEEYFLGLRAEDIPIEIFAETISTIEGSKALIRPKAREVDGQPPSSKGQIANVLESEIASFDRQQKYGYMIVLEGLQRIRGLAGSGKTVVLAMKAALTHLRYPDAYVLYTFYTKSLYQHIQRLITRFYRQFDDRDPDWTHLRIMHSWGGRTDDGVYYSTCLASGVQPAKYSDLAGVQGDRFDYVCKRLLVSAAISPTYDFIFIDEGQDFKASFIQLCLKLVTNNRVVFAYDDLQTIFQAATPTIDEIVGTDKTGKPLIDLTEDVVLHKCYRNPREIIVCAHALGFGFYGKKIVQMLEKSEQWEDVGYAVIHGEFVEGSQTIIERPIENSLTIVSSKQNPNDIIQALVYESFVDEIEGTVRSIKQDIENGLKPEDILVVVVDDRNAKNYLNNVAQGLARLGVQVNNMHADSYGIRDFSQENEVTLSTVHKAKGNEAYMVYVLGVDALYSSIPSVRERNMLFTAMTRAKAWLRLSGIGAGAVECKQEVEIALTKFPRLEFVYPSPEQLKIIRRDLAERASRKQRIERLLDDALSGMSPDEIKTYIEQRTIRKGN